MVRWGRLHTAPAKHFVLVIEILVVDQVNVGGHGFGEEGKNICKDSEADKHVDVPELDRAWFLGHEVAESNGR
jgi:hypothetical protein